MKNKKLIITICSLIIGVIIILFFCAIKYNDIKQIEDITNKFNKLSKIDNSKNEYVNVNNVINKLNETKNETEYKNTLKSTLNYYYTIEDNKSIKKINNSVNSYGEEITKNYEEAYNERKNKDLDYDSDTIIINADKKDEKKIKKIITEYDGKVENVVDLEDGKIMIVAKNSLEFTVDKSIKNITNEINVTAEPNYIVKINENDYKIKSIKPYATANYESYDYLWHFSSTYGIDIHSAWAKANTVSNKEKVKVGVIDTGVYADHEDLTSALSYAKTNNKLVTIDQTNGTIVNGISDDHGHGTHVTGLIGATNNSMGVVGAASGTNNDMVDVIVVDAYNYNGTTGNFYTADLVASINYLVGEDVKVINMSLGGQFLNLTLENTLKTAKEAGVTIIAAAGNEDTDSYTSPSDSDSVISVTSVNADKNRSSFSNHNEFKDIAAPGGVYPDDSGEIYVASTVPYCTDGNCVSSYAYMAGTSQASPIVAGVVAMGLSVNPSLTPDEIASYLYETATDLGDTGRDDYYGYGLVNPTKFLTSVIGYTITYNLDGGQANNKSIYNEETETFTLTNPTKLGYVFTGWTGSNGSTPELTVTITKGSTGNKEYTAHYEPINYQIKYDNNGGTGSMDNSTHTYDLEKSLTKNTFTRTGYTFKNWNTKAAGKGTTYTDEALVKNLTSVNNKVITLYAIWDIVNYTINYELDGGTISGSNLTTYNVETESFTLINPTKEGYVFTGWTGSNGSTKETNVTIPKGSTGNKTYTAHFEKLTYQVHYDNNGGTGVMENSVHTYNETKTLTKNTFTRNGYTFSNWNLSSDGNGTNYQDEESVMNLTLEDNKVINMYAMWDVITYNITYNLDGGVSSNPSTYNVETNTITLTNPTKEGYVFTGWTGSNGSTKETNVTIPKGSTGNKEYTANYEKIKYQIKYDNNGGTGSISNTTYEYNESKKLTKNIFTRLGYNFIGWNTKSNGTGTNYFDEEEVNNLTLEDNKVITLYALWDKVNYSIAYTLNDGVANNINSYNVETNTFTLTNPTKENYNFIGWTGSNGNTPELEVTIEKGTTGNLAFVANYAEINYTVHYNSNEGTGEMSDSTHSMGASKKLNKNTFTRLGYTFKEWNTRDDGEGISYSDEENVVNITDEDSITLYAIWTKDSYIISYPNGGSDINNTSYNIDTEDFTLTNPTKEGYIFTGWTGSNGSTKELSVTISKGSTGNKTYTANYDPIKYKIVFNSNNAEGTMNDMEYTYDDTKALSLNTFTKTEYYFKEWNTSIDGNGTSYTNGQNILNLTSENNKIITLYAIWERVVYKINKANVSGYLNSYNSIYLNWTNLGNVDGYKVYYKEYSQKTWNIFYSYINKTGIYSLSPGKTYQIKVVGFKKSSFGEFSNIYTIKTLAKPNIKLKKKGTTQIKISWGKVDGASGYKVYRKLKGKKWKKVKTTSKTSYTNGGLYRGKKYYYKVRAYKKVNGKTIYTPYSSTKKIKR